MTQQGSTKQRLGARPPWPPMSVSLSALLFPAFPAGAAILTILNLQRLGEISASTARRLSIVSLLVFALGFSALALLAHRDSHGIPQIDTGVGYVLAVGVGAASYVVQRLPWRDWRKGNAGKIPSSWLTAVGMSVVYECVAVLVAVPILVIALTVSSSAGTLPR